MPTYAYNCRHCDEEIEIFHSMSAPAVTVCPQCEKPGLTRMISAGAGLIFKGTGFYETDYKRSSAGGKKDSGSADSVSTTPGKEKSSESKNAAKASA